MSLRTDEGAQRAFVAAAKLRDAERFYFLRVAELRPNVELASLGLFHCLWHLGDEDAARQELVRFASKNDSKESALLLEEMGWHLDRETATLTLEAASTTRER